VKVSCSWRCASAALVSNTSVDLPDPDTPVTTVSARLGTLTVMSLRLCCLAPVTRMASAGMDASFLPQQ